MRSRFSALLLAVLATLSCSGPDLVTPGYTSGSDRTALRIRPTFPKLPRYPSLTLARVQVIAANGPSAGSVILEKEAPVSGPTSFDVLVDVPRGLRGATRAAYLLELRGAGEVEWSARSDTFDLSPGSTLSLGIPMGRGPLANLDARSVAFIEEGPVVVDGGWGHLLRVTASHGARPFLHALDERIAQVTDDVPGVIGVAPGTTAVVALAGFAADTIPVVVQPAPASLAVTPAEVEVATVPDTVTFTLSVRDSLGNALRVTPALYNWLSSNPAVAGYLGDGQVEARGTGDATITVLSVRNPAARATIRWTTRRHAARLVLNPRVDTLAGLNRPHALSVDAFDARGVAIPTVATTWRVSGPASLAASPDSSPMRRLLVPTGTVGDVAVTVSADGVEAEARYHVGPAIDHLAITGPTVLPSLGATARLAAESVNELGERQPIAVRWSSSDSAVVSIDAGGAITARDEGDALITATSDAPRLSDSRRVSVRVPATRIEWYDGDPNAPDPALSYWLAMHARALTPKGYPVEGEWIRWSASGGVLHETTALSGWMGLAQAWWYTHDLGTWTVTATLARTGASVTRTLRLLPGVVARLDPIALPSDSARSGERFARQPAFQARDILGNPVARAGIPVTVSMAPPGNGDVATLAGTTTALTDASGMVRFTDLAIRGTFGLYWLEFRTPETWFVKTVSVLVQ